MTSTPTRGEVRRSALLDAALDLFSVHGYEGTTTRRVAERVGVTEAAVFRYFSSKRQLFTAVVEEFGPRSFVISESGIDDLPVKRALSHLLNGYLDVVWEGRAGLRVIILEAWRDPEAGAQLRNQFAGHHDGLKRLLRRRALRGEIRTGIEDASASIIASAVSGFLHRSIRSEPADWPTDRVRFVDDLVGLLIDGIGVKAPDSRGQE